MGRATAGLAGKDASVTVTLRCYDPASDGALLPQLSSLLIEAVTAGASIGFMADITRDKADAFWSARLAAAAHGDCRLLLAFVGDQLAGTVSLLVDTPPNQPHRADVSKMIVGRAFRQQGIGAMLLAGVEAEARALGRTTLVLDTISHSAAARLYERGGWQRIGEISAYALMPDGAMAPTTLYARHLGS
jgi:GNAT superfamily N-acetyltransferase